MDGALNHVLGLSSTQCTRFLANISQKNAVHILFAVEGDSWYAPETMTDEKTIQGIFEILKSMQGSMVTKDDAKSFLTKDDARQFATKSDIAELRGDITEMKGDITEMKGDVASLKERMTALEDDSEFMRDNMATKEDVAASEARVLTHIDGLAKRHEFLDHELVAGRARSERIEERVEVLEFKTGIRTKVAA